MRVAGTMRRRDFLARGFSVAAASLAAARLGAQEASGADVARSTNGAAMDQAAYRPVRLPAKPGGRALLTDAQRDEVEHHIHCQCGCGLDVYTCRTTDFSCGVSPAMHLDVMGLVAGGYGGDEIITAFRRVYGERVLMAPAKEGFNWLGYLLPFGALATGAVLVLALLKRWSSPVSDAASVLPASDATPEELRRLRDVLRSDE